jgi:hypothetical protein
MVSVLPVFVPGDVNGSAHERFRCSQCPLLEGCTMHGASTLYETLDTVHIDSAITITLVDPVLITSCRMLAAGVITGGGTYAAGALSPQSSIPPPNTSTKSAAKAEEPAAIPSHPGDVQAEKNRRKAEYEGDHPKPVEDRHGDTVSKHSIAAKKNQTKVRVGKFSKEEFDNHIQSHSPDPCDDFEKVEKEKEDAKKEKGKK